MGDVKEIPLTGKHGYGRVALVDDEDYALVSHRKWHAKVDEGGRIYACTSINTPSGTRHVRMHKLLTGYTLTDHRNGNGLDNQRHNLRPATNAQNVMNKGARPDNTSGFKGVTREAHGWRAVIKANGARRHLGYFSTPELAARAYDAAAVEMHGEFARFNFPDDPQHEMPKPAVRYCARPDCGKELQGRRSHAVHCSPGCRKVMEYRQKRIAQGATLRKSPRKKAA